MVTNVWDEMSWWQLYDVCDSFGHFGHQHPLSFYISVGHLHSNDVNIMMSPTSLSLYMNVKNGLTCCWKMKFQKWKSWWGPVEVLVNIFSKFVQNFPTKPKTGHFKGSFQLQVFSTCIFQLVSFINVNQDFLLRLFCKNNDFEQYFSAKNATLEKDVTASLVDSRNICPLLLTDFFINLLLIIFSSQICKYRHTSNMGSEN